jgi:5-methylcytosine-specific restriction endonuclease McrA
MNILKDKAKHAFKVFFSAVREKSKLLRRDSLWPMVRAAHLEYNGSCAACGEEEKIQVHHIIPVHIDHTFELDSNNLITLCMSQHECHLNIGHKGSWRNCNPNVKNDARDFYAKLKT